MRLAIGAFKIGPINSIYNIAGEPRPNLKLLEITLLFVARSYRTPDVS